MTKSADRERLDWIEALILEAARVDRALPSPRPKGFHAAWPETMTDDDDDPVAGPVRRRGPTGRMSVCDAVLLDWLGPASVLAVREKELIWTRLGRGRRLPWPVVAKALLCSDTKAKMDFSRALSKLARHLGPDALARYPVL